MSDALAEALKSPASPLAEILLKRLPVCQPAVDPPADIIKRLDRLIEAPGDAGSYARTRLAANLGALFERLPAWTRAKIIPLFDWACPQAADAWSARMHDNYIGSPELFGYTKGPLLELFGRSEPGLEEIRVFSQWLITILVAKRRDQLPYPLTEAEVRSALRRAGHRALPTVAHRLTAEMARSAVGTKSSAWQELVSPIFEGVWPLDVELQTPAATFALVQLLRATEEAFPIAVDAVVPFIRPDDHGGHSTVLALADAPEVLFRSAPAKMLELAAAVIGDPERGSVYGLHQVLQRVCDADAALEETRKFQRLLSCAATL